MTLVLEVAESAAHTQPVIMKRYSAAADTLERIAALVNAHEMTAWAERPDYLEVCDAPHPYIILTVLTEDYERIEYVISGYINFTEEEQAVYSAVRDIILESECEENLIETYPIDRDELY